MAAPERLVEEPELPALSAPPLPAPLPAPDDSPQVEPRHRWWHWRPSTPPVERHLLALVILVSSVAYAFAARMRLRGGTPAGDEPAYLVLSKAMAKYHSLDVTRVYNNRDYYSFYPALLAPHTVVGAHGQAEPLHQIAGPLLWLVPFMLWGRAGAVGFMIVVSVLTLVNIYYFLRERGIDPPYAFAVTLVLAIGSPIYVLSSMSFVEPIGTLAIIFAIRAVLMPGRLSAVRLTVASIGVALAPWVHMRFAPTSLVLGLLLLVRVWQDNRRERFWPYVQCLAPLALSVVLVEVYTIVLYGTVDPMAPQAIYGVSVFDVPLYKGFAGTLFDRNYGLLDNFPLFLLVLPGILLALRREYRRTNLALLAVIVPYVVMSCTSTTWWGGYNPAGRYISVLVPLFAFYLALVLQRVNSWVATGTAVLLGAGGYALALCTDIFPNERFTGYDLRNHGMERLGHLIGFNFVKLAPSSFERGQVGLFLGWTVAAVVVGLAFWLLGSRAGILRLLHRAEG